MQGCTRHHVDIKTGLKGVIGAGSNKSASLFIASEGCWQVKSAVCTQEEEQQSRGKADYLSRVLEELHETSVKACACALVMQRKRLYRGHSPCKVTTTSCVPPFHRIHNHLRLKLKGEGGAPKWATTLLQQNRARNWEME
jgi:hypothetical protein